MGAIVGFVGKKSSPELIDKMLSCQKYRGGERYFIISKDLVNIGMNNSHIDYPEPDYSKKETITLIDGIVANIKKHSEVLAKEGIKDSDKSPSSIISHLYELYKNDTFSKLEGEFTSAIWSSKQNQIILMRDRFGHKPLFYYYDKDCLIFSSEIKGILAAGVERSADLVTISDYLSLGIFPSPGTPFKGIYKLNPGHLLIYSPGREPVKKKWFDQTISEDRQLDYANTMPKFKEKLCDAINRRAPEQVVHSFLSGGIDSSALVGLLSIMGKTVNSYALGFHEDKFNELGDARVVADHFKTNHTENYLSNDEFLSSINTILHHYDEPFWDTSAFPTYFCSKKVRDYTDRIITGDGPDQLYAGSNCFKPLYELDTTELSNIQSILRTGLNLAYKFTKLPPDSSFVGSVYRKLFFKSLSPLERSIDFLLYLPLKKHLCTDDFFEYHLKNHPLRGTIPNTRNPIKDLISWQSGYMVPDDLMTKVDRCTMAHGLETLSPFQDSELFELTRSFPSNFFVQEENGNRITKYILKKLSADFLPDQILNKPKKGFSMPLEKFLLERGHDMIKDTLLSDRAIQRGYFNKKNLTLLVDCFLNKSGNWFYGDSNTIFGLLSLELWHREYLEGAS
jgi:asparagine synthase (glutamine-hydrolysing)